MSVIKFTSLRIFCSAAALGFIVGLPAQAAETIQIAIDASWKPFGYVDENGQLTGFDVDMSKALCAQMPQYDCKLISVPWDGMFAGLEAGKFDAIVSGVNITPERKQIMDFTDPYFVSRFVWMVPADSELDGSFDGFKGHVIGTLGGSVWEKYLRESYGDSIDMQVYDNVDNITLDLGIGRVEAMLGDDVQLVGSYAEAQPDTYKIVGEPISDSTLIGEGKGIAVQKGNDTLRQAFNAAIAKIVENGEHAAISKKYLGFAVAQKP